MERQSLIFRINQKEAAGITTPTGSRITEIPLLDLNNQLDYGIHQTIESIQELGLEVTTTGCELLLVAAAVYAADKRLKRAEISQDGWTREIDIYLPVNQPELWNAIRDHLQKALGFLTGDLWRFSFRKTSQQLTKLNVFARKLEAPQPTELCLFSGGLDSLIGAIDLLEKGRIPLLVSHSWVTNDTNHQNTCLAALRRQYGTDRVTQVRSRIGFGDQDLNITKENEITERSRSFLFFCIAAAAASGLKTETPTVVPENGLISLNIPLDPLRLGAFSTRTTHPYFIARFNEFLKQLKIPTQLENPYRHQTKGEMMLGCKNQKLLGSTLADTVSCSSIAKARWKSQPPGHCGHCVPCIIRRAAVLASKMPDQTSYTIGLLNSKSHPSNQAEGEHIRSFQLAIHHLGKERGFAKIIVQRAGPLSDYPGELGKYADMYCRGLDEVEALLRGVKTVPHV